MAGNRQRRGQVYQGKSLAALAARRMAAGSGVARALFDVGEIQRRCSMNVSRRRVGSVWVLVARASASASRSRADRPDVAVAAPRGAGHEFDLAFVFIDDRHRRHARCAPGAPRRTAGRHPARPLEDDDLRRGLRQARYRTLVIDGPMNGKRSWPMSNKSWPQALPETSSDGQSQRS